MPQAPNSFWLPSNNPGSPSSTLSPPTPQERSYTVTSPPPSSSQPPQSQPTPDHATESLSVFGLPISPSFPPQISLTPTIYQPPPLPSKWDMIGSSSSLSPYPYPRLWQPQVTYPTNFTNSHERLGTYRSLTSALTGTRALQSIENKIDRIEALAYQKDAKAVADKGSGLLSQEALEGMMKSRFDSFFGQVTERVEQMVRQEVSQYIDTVRLGIKDVHTTQEAMMAALTESREQDWEGTRREIKVQLQGLLESIKAEGSIRHQRTEQQLAKLLSDQSTAIQGLDQNQDQLAKLQGQSDRNAQDVVESVQELRGAVEKLMPVLHMLHTNNLPHQQEMRRMISDIQQGFVATDLAHRLDKDESCKRYLEVDENLNAIETRVEELVEDFSELSETLKNRHEDLVKEIEGLKTQQDQILTSLQENHRQQQQYLESKLQSPAVSEVASGSTLINEPQEAGTARQRVRRPTHGPKAPNAGGDTSVAPLHPFLVNNDSDQNPQRKRIKIEPGTSTKHPERTMMTRMMSKVLGGIIT
ncbi:MAG: hypothetical protein BYD32DRAFT_439180 [Podila humilis]|nr:MAG: hypothetical protein BYD32DRAFT_439180 [Podila humilis]